MTGGQRVLWPYHLRICRPRTCEKPSAPHSMATLQTHQTLEPARVPRTECTTPIQLCCQNGPAGDRWFHITGPHVNSQSLRCSQEPGWPPGIMCPLVWGTYGRGSTNIISGLLRTVLRESPPILQLEVSTELVRSTATLQGQRPSGDTWGCAEETPHAAKHSTQSMWPTSRAQTHLLVVANDRAVFFNLGFCLVELPTAHFF